MINFSPKNKKRSILLIIIIMKNFSICQEKMGKMGKGVIVI
jgi:hypothetical protein